MPEFQNLRSRVLALLLVLGLAALGAAGSLQAQGAPSYDKKTLRAFATAMVKVEEVREVYTPQIGEAGNKEAAQRLQREANDLMVQAIREQGLDVPTYNQLAQAMQQDRDLRGRIMELVEQVRS